MPVRVIDFYTSKMVDNHPDWLFVFGDNIERKGRGGQAAACRGKVNAIGIPTKWAPQRDKYSYFRDADLLDVAPTILQGFCDIRRALLEDRTVVFPKDGLGTGLAELPTKAPAIFSLVQACVDCIMIEAEAMEQT